MVPQTAQRSAHLTALPTAQQMEHQTAQLMGRLTAHCSEMQTAQPQGRQTVPYLARLTVFQKVPQTEYPRRTASATDTATRWQRIVKLTR